MNRFPVIWMVIPLLALSCGCTHDQLRRSTSQTQASMSDLRYKHILDNLAMMVRNPATVPNPVAINGGVVQISDNVYGRWQYHLESPSRGRGSFHSIFSGLRAAGRFPNSGR